MSIARTEQIWIGVLELGEYVRGRGREPGPKSGRLELVDRRDPRREQVQLRARSRTLGGLEALEDPLGSPQQACREPGETTDLDAVAAPRSAMLDPV